MKHYYKLYFKIFTIINLALYLIVAFVKFDILWIKEIPDYTTEARGFMILFWLIIQISLANICLVIEEKERKH